MEENKFERQVQQKMDELKIHPSDSVWAKIEARLDKKRPSRRAFWLLLFAGILLSAGYFLWNSNRYSNVSDQTPGITTSKKTTNQSQAKNNDNTDNNSQAKINSGSTNEPLGQVDKGPANKNNYKNTSVRVKYNGNKKMAAEEKNIGPASGQVAENNSGKIQSQILNGSSDEDQPAAKEKAVEEVAGKSGDKVTKPDLQKTDSTKNLSKASDTSKSSVGSSSVAISKKKSTWQFGMSLSGGISAVGNDFLGLANPIPYDYVNAVGQVALPPIIVQTALPSRSRPAFGFIIGLVAEKYISPVVKIATGINFKSFNTSNKVGTRNTLGYYSSRITLNNHNNHFDFIEVPVALKVQLGKGKKIPISWQGGFVVSELISSNALQFNSTSGLYYKDNSSFNKTLFGLNTSLSASLFFNRKTSLSIGPYFYYGVSKLANDGLYNKKHFVFTGLSTAIMFGK